MQLGNHLGNVLVTISDRKKGIADPLNAALIKFFEPVMLSGTDYYPFGMPMRIGGDSSYRYGFNGKENDNEVKGGDGLQLDYGFRVYDSRIGKFLSVDPLTSTYPWYTPYQFAGNKPTWATDVDGLEENTTSTYVKKPVVILPKPTFAGIINITDATTQTVHKTFTGSFAQLKKSDATGLAPSLVKQLTGSNIGNSTSSLDITMKGTRSEVSKTWKGTDIKYFTQYAYSLKSNDVTETGTFEVQTGQIQASSRAWDALAFPIVNKVLNSVIGTLAKGATTVASQEMVTLYRSVSKAEAEGITQSGKLSLGAGMEVKQFWQTKEGLNAWNKTALAGEYNLEIVVPKSMLGNGKPLNTAVQVDEFIGPNATIDRAFIETVNKSLQSFKITPIK